MGELIAFLLCLYMAVVAVALQLSFFVIIVRYRKQIFDWCSGKTN